MSVASHPADGLGLGWGSGEGQSGSLGGGFVVPRIAKEVVVLIGSWAEAGPHLQAASARAEPDVQRACLSGSFPF